MNTGTGPGDTPARVAPETVRVGAESSTASWSSLGVPLIVSVSIIVGFGVVVGLSPVMITVLVALAVLLTVLQLLTFTRPFVVIDEAGVEVRTVRSSSHLRIPASDVVAVRSMRAGQFRIRMPGLALRSGAEIRLPLLRLHQRDLGPGLDVIGEILDAPVVDASAYAERVRRSSRRPWFNRSPWRLRLVGASLALVVVTAIAGVQGLWLYAFDAEPPLRATVGIFEPGDSAALSAGETYGIYVLAGVGGMQVTAPSGEVTEIEVERRERFPQSLRTLPLRLETVGDYQAQEPGLHRIDVVARDGAPLVSATVMVGDPTGSSRPVRGTAGLVFGVIGAVTTVSLLVAIFFLVSSRRRDLAPYVVGR